MELTPVRLYVTDNKEIAQALAGKLGCQYFHQQSTSSIILSLATCRAAVISGDPKRFASVYPLARSMGMDIQTNVVSAGPDELIRNRDEQGDSKDEIYLWPGDVKYVSLEVAGAGGNFHVTVWHQASQKSFPCVSELALLASIKEVTGELVLTRTGKAVDLRAQLGTWIPAAHVTLEVAPGRLPGENYKFFKSGDVKPILPKTTVSFLVRELRFHT